jgi:CRP-like cAMP-binding protein
VAYASGELLLTEGEAANTLFLLRRGRIAIEIHAPGRGPIVVETVGPGATVGWSWLFPPYRWQFDARAIDSVGVIAIDGACLRAKADADDALGHQLAGASGLFREAVMFSLVSGHISEAAA